MPIFWKYRDIFNTKKYFDIFSAIYRFAKNIAIFSNRRYYQQWVKEPFIQRGQKIEPLQGIQGSNEYWFMRGSSSFDKKTHVMFSYGVSR